MEILTHRGLDPSRKDYFSESSREAFLDQLNRGYGLEFDVQFTADNQMVASHDASLARISGGYDARLIADLTLNQLLSLEFNGCHMIGVTGLLAEIMKSPARISALHLKHNNQTAAQLDGILNVTNNIDSARLIIFDVKPETAKNLKAGNPNLQLAPSVAHPYDIKRYNSATGGTLLSVEETLNNKKLFSWVWLDEWDRIGAGGVNKKLYTQETFDIFKKAGLKIALVTPELHAISPGLLGGEFHQDAKNQETLFERIREIIRLNPDAICTDFPDFIKDYICPLSRMAF